jgi:C4-dicarboxylate transporter DctQ subunit
MKLWEQVDEAIGRVEQALLVLLLGFMLCVAFLQIVLRNLFFTGLDWGDLLVRNLVLWVGFIGATLATKEEKHISIDLVSRWLPLLGKHIAALIIHVFAFFVCGGLAYAALKFINNELQLGDKTFLGIPAWVPELILPLTFVLMTFRFGLRAFKDFAEMKALNPPRDRKKKR